MYVYIYIYIYILLPVTCVAGQQVKCNTCLHMCVLILEPFVVLTVTSPPPSLSYGRYTCPSKANSNIATF